VLKAARDARVKRVVLTSTCGAISAYGKSKALAERAAWDFMAGLFLVNRVGRPSDRKARPAVRRSISGSSTSATSLTCTCARW
jgi:hypothetical protein